MEGPRAARLSELQQVINLINLVLWYKGFLTIERKVVKSPAAAGLFL